MRVLRVEGAPASAENRVYVPSVYFLDKEDDYEDVYLWSQKIS